MSEQAITVSKANTLEQVVINGDLSKLSQAERVNYYRLTCESLGLNPFTRPFDYITLNGKLTLYAKKDATDQLRSIKGVSIDDVDIRETDDTYIVKVKGHDNTGRSDVEIGVVLKSDMQKHPANLQMKAVTKAKRRLTLSLCGLGWLDETEIETIPNAKVVNVTPEGEIIDHVEAVPAPAPEPEQKKSKSSFDEQAFLKNFNAKPALSQDDAYEEMDSTGKLYKLLPTEELFHCMNGLMQAVRKPTDFEKQALDQRKLEAVQVILLERKAELETA